MPVNSLANDKILDHSSLKDLADDTINVTYKMNLEIRRVENSVGKGKNAGYQHLLYFPHCFQKASLSRLLKVELFFVRLVQIKSNCRRQKL